MARRVVVWVAVGLVGVTLLYLAAMNVFLRTRLFRDAITSDRGLLRIDYSSAYSLVPGHIHVENLAIRGRDSNVEWILTIDRCDFHQSFIDLLRRRFHASHVRGDGLTMRLRQRLERIAPSAAALPPVPGFLDPPLADVGPEEPPLSDADYALWSVQLDDVIASHVRELWIDTVRTTGDLRITGRWFFRPLRWLDIGPAAIDLRSANVSYGGEAASAPLALDVHGVVVATVNPVDIRDAGGDVMLDHVACDADLRGAIAPESIVERLAGGAAGKALLSAWAIEPAATHVVADHTASTVAVDIPDVEVVSRGGIRALMPMPEGFDLDVQRFTVSLHGDVDLKQRALRGHVGVLAPALKVRTGDDAMTGALKLDIEAAARTSVVDFSGSTATFTSRVASPPEAAPPASAHTDIRPDAHGPSGVAAKQGTPATEPWWLRVGIEDARLDAGGDGSRFHARMAASAKNGAPVSAFLAKATPLPRWVIDAVPTDDLRITGEVHLRPSVFEVRSVHARADGSSVDFEFEKLAYWKEWALLLQAGFVRAGIRSGDGGTEVVLFNAQPWFVAQTSAFRTNASRER